MSTLTADCLSSFTQAYRNAQSALEDATYTFNRYENLLSAVEQALTADTIEQKIEILNADIFEQEDVTEQEVDVEFQVLITSIERAQNHFDRADSAGVVEGGGEIEIYFDDLTDYAYVEQTVRGVDRWCEKAESIIDNLVSRRHIFIHEDQLITSIEINQ